MVAYRDHLKKKYITKGFLAKIVSKNEKTTTQRDELDLCFLKSPIIEAVKYFESKIIDIENNKDNLVDQGDTCQSKLFNAQTALSFLKSL